MSPSRDDSRENKLQRTPKGPRKEDATKPATESLEKGAKAKARETTPDLPPPTEPAAPPAGAPAKGERKPATDGQINAIKSAKTHPEVRQAWYASMDEALKTKAMKTVEQGARTGEQVPAIFKSTIDKIKMGRLNELSSLEASQAIDLLPELDKDPEGPVSERQKPVVTSILGHMVRSQAVEGATNTFDNHVQANLPDVYEKLQAEGAEGLTYGEADALIKLEKVFNAATKQERDAAREKMLVSPATDKQLNSITEILAAHPALHAKLPEDFSTRMDKGQLKGADVDAVFKLDNERKKELVTSLIPKIKEIGNEDLKMVASILSSRLEEKVGKTFAKNFVDVQHDKLKALKADPESKEFKNSYYDFVKYNNADALDFALNQYAQV